MRRGELLALQWENVDLDRQTAAHLPESKNGDSRTVPLSTRAVVACVARQRGCDLSENLAWGEIFWFDH
jgi:integrase